MNRPGLYIFCERFVLSSHWSNFATNISIDESNECQYAKTGTYSEVQVL